MTRQRHFPKDTLPTRLLHMHSKPAFQPDEYIAYITASFLREADPLRAEKQMAYMRNQFEYCGLPASVWYPMIKLIFREHGMYNGPDLKKFVNGCYEQGYREVMYAGIEMMQRMLQHQPAPFITFIEKCLTTYSWWDSVDWIAKLVGIHFKHHPELQEPYCYKWIASSNMWLQRAAIIHQLFYREATNEKLLFDLIKSKLGDKEFFIRKACGWALRQYSKERPERVIWFVENHELSPLSYKEAVRLLPN